MGSYGQRHAEGMPQVQKPLLEHTEESSHEQVSLEECGDARLPPRSADATTQERKQMGNQPSPTGGIFGYLQPLTGNQPAATGTLSAYRPDVHPAYSSSYTKPPFAPEDTFAAGEIERVRKEAYERGVQEAQAANRGIERLNRQNEAEALASKDREIAELRRENRVLKVQLGLADPEPLDLPPFSVDDFLPDRSDN